MYIYVFMYRTTRNWFLNSYTTLGCQRARHLVSNRTAAASDLFSMASSPALPLYASRYPTPNGYPQINGEVDAPLDFRKVESLRRYVRWYSPIWVGGHGYVEQNVKNKKETMRERAYWNATYQETGRSCQLRTTNQQSTSTVRER